jgi:hypothetical protein
LPHLARSNHDQIRAVAAQELSNTDGTVDVLVSLGDAWWEVAETLAERERPQLLRRARYWYGRVDPSELSGIRKLKVEKRQQEITDLLAKLDPPTWTTDDDAASAEVARPTDGDQPASDEFRSTFSRGVTAALREHDFTAAERLFGRCARLQPHHVPSLNNYALTSIRRRNYRRAIHLWEEAADLAPQSPTLRHNFERFRRFADGDPIRLESSLRKTLEQLCAKTGNPGTYRSSTGWLYLPIDAASDDYPSSSYEDRRCMYCGGTGKVDCSVRGCSRGTVRSTRTDVVGRNSITGQPIVKTVPIRVPCRGCYGRGQVDCDHCTGGISRSLY